jgi:glycosyltransferase involved in cell wall biosynthesis
LAYGAVERFVGPSSDRVIFVNHEERKLALDRGWLKESQAVTIYNGVDLGRLSPQGRGRARARLRAEWGIDQDEAVILYVGRLEYPKQPWLLPHIAAALARLAPRSRWRLVIAGSGPDEDTVRGLVERLSVLRRVLLLGWQPEPLDLYHAADVVLLPSLAEGLPRALIEAHAAGVPVVASNAKGNREVVSRATGILCPPQDVAAYATALARLIDDHEQRSTLGRAARERAEQLFDSQKNNRQIIAVYETLLARQGLLESPAERLRAAA